MMNTNVSEDVKRYLASLFSGDGNVNIRKHGNSAQVRTSLGFTYMPILSKISSILNVGNVNYVKKEEYKIKNFHKQQWKWELHSDDAVQFLKMILPYLPEKGEQARQSIEFQKWKSKNLKGTRLTTKDQMMYCEKMIEEVKKLKEQFTTIEDVEKYNMFKKKHYNLDIENGLQSTLGGFSDDFFMISEEKKKAVDEAKKLISPDINLNVIENMTNPSFAGFFDAEGMVSVLKGFDHMNDVRYTLYVNIENSNFSIIDRYCREFGGSVSDPRKRKDNRKITWLWSILSTDALSFLNHILPYTIEKREQIELAIEFQTRRNNGILTQEKAKSIHQKITNLKHTEYTTNGNIRILPHGDKETLKEMKNDNILIKKEVDYHNELLNNTNKEYDSSYFDSNYRDNKDFNTNENQSELGF